MPHPDEFEFDLNAPSLMKYHGPRDERHKARWDAMLEKREACLEEAQFIEGMIKNGDDASGALASRVAHLKQLADMIISLLPSPEIRRRPGFDLEAWRTKSKGRQKAEELKASLQHRAA